RDGRTGFPRDVLLRNSRTGAVWNTLLRDGRTGDLRDVLLRNSRTGAFRTALLRDGRTEVVRTALRPVLGIGGPVRQRRAVLPREFRGTVRFRGFDRGDRRIRGGHRSGGEDRADQVGQVGRGPVVAGLVGAEPGEQLRRGGPPVGVLLPARVDQLSQVVGEFGQFGWRADDARDDRPDRVGHVRGA